jgi:hypothetical protein
MGWLHKVKRYDDEYGDYFVSYKRVCYEVDQTHKRNRLLHEGFKFTLFVFIFIIFSMTEQVEIRSQLNQAVRNQLVSTPFECGHLRHVEGAGLAGSGKGAEAGSAQRRRRLLAGGGANGTNGTGASPGSHIYDGAGWETPTVYMELYFDEFR